MKLANMMVGNRHTHTLPHVDDCLFFARQMGLMDLFSFASPGTLQELTTRIRKLVAGS